MNGSAALKAWLAGPSRIGLIALAAVLATAVLLALAARPLLTIALGQPVASEQGEPGAAPASFASEMQLAVSRFNGRSLFFIPPAPPPEPEPVVDREPTDPGPPPPPSRYAGPALVAMVNDAAWFADGRRLVVGAEPDNGLAIVSLSAPWSAKVRWRGAEFDVGLFDRSPVLSGQPAAPSSSPPPPPPPPTRPAASPPADDPRQPEPEAPPEFQPEPEPDPEPIFEPIPEPAPEPAPPEPDPQPDPEPEHR